MKDPRLVLHIRTTLESLQPQQKVEYLQQLQQWCQKRIQDIANKANHPDVEKVDE